MPWTNPRFRAPVVERLIGRVDPDNGPLLSEEPDPVPQEATSHSRPASPVDNDPRDFRAKAAVPRPRKEQRGSVFLGILVVVFGVLSGLAAIVVVSTELVMAGFEKNSIQSQLLALVRGAAPLVYARGRNAAIGTVVFSAVELVAMILVYYPQGATGIDVQIPGGPCSLLFEPQLYHFVPPSVVDSFALQKEGTQHIRFRARRKLLCNMYLLTHWSVL